MRTALLALMLLAGCTSTGVLSPDAGTGTYKNVNDARRAFGIAALQSDPVLTRMAREQAGLMAANLKMNHTAAPGKGFTARLKRAGWRGRAAENLAEGYETRSEALQAWVDSPPHRKNLLDRRMTRYGIGVAEGDHPTRGKRKYWALVVGG